jgi:hypothetical protein
MADEEGKHEDGDDTWPVVFEVGVEDVHEQVSCRQV